MNQAKNGLLNEVSQLELDINNIMHKLNKKALATFILWTEKVGSDL
jgi:hypothetical protein